MALTLPKTPSSYSQLLTLSFAVYKASFRRIIALSIFLSIVVFVPRFLSDVIGQDIFFDVPPLSLHRLWLVVIDLVALIFYVALLWRVQSFMLHHNEPIDEDMKVGVRKFVAVFITTIVSTLIIFAASLIFYGFGMLVHTYFDTGAQLTATSALMLGCIFAVQLALMVYLATLFVFVAPIVAVKNKNVLAAYTLSIRLTWNHWWRAFSFQITPWLAYLCLIIIIKYIFHFDLHLYFAGNQPHSFISTVVNLIIFALFIPWVAAVQLVQLRDLILR